MTSFTKISSLTAVFALLAGGMAFADNGKAAGQAARTNPNGGIVGRPSTHIDVDSNPHANPHGKMVGKHHAKANIRGRIVSLTPTSVTVRLRSGAVQTYVITPAQYALLKADVNLPIVYTVSGGTFVVIHP